jgi:hypothetical protein
MNQSELLTTSWALGKRMRAFFLLYKDIVLLLYLTISHGHKAAVKRAFKQYACSPILPQDRTT